MSQKLSLHPHVFLFSSWVAEISSWLHMRQVTVITYPISEIWYVNILQPLSNLKFQLTVNKATCMVCFCGISKQLTTERCLDKILLHQSLMLLGMQDFKIKENSGNQAHISLTMLPQIRFSTLLLLTCSSKHYAAAWIFSTYNF